MDILAIIDKYNLSIRKIPETVTELWTYYEGTPLKEGAEIITMTAEDMGSSTPKIFNKNFPNGRKFQKITKIPEHAGWYMCKTVNNTNSQVRWFIDKDNLAPSLEESIKKFLNSQK